MFASTTRPIPLIRAAVGLSAVDLLRELGVPAERFWQAAGLAHASGLAPHALVPLHTILRFFETAAIREDLPDLGLRLASRSGLAGVGAFGTAIAQAPTLNAALDVARYGVTGHNSGAQYWTILEGENVRLCRRFRSSDQNFRQADLLTIALMVGLVHGVAGPDWYPERIELQSTGPSLRDALGPFADTTVEVERPFSSITFPRALLSRAMPPSGGTSPTALSAAQWRASAPPPDFLTSLEVVVESLLEGGRTDVQSAAAAAGSSVRSLQRRLTELGVSYSAVVERVRFRIASELLRDERVKIIDVAIATGYSDPAHFTRAFRRWTAQTPLAYRRQELRGAAARRTA
jgi:AraC-like DNA-binding protein